MKKWRFFIKMKYCEYFEQKKPAFLPVFFIHSPKKY